MWKLWTTVILCGLCAVGLTQGQPPAPKNDPGAGVAKKKDDPKAGTKKKSIQSATANETPLASGVTPVLVDAQKIDVTAVLNKEMGETVHATKAWFLLLNGHSPSIPETPGSIPLANLTNTSTDTTTWKYTFTNVRTPQKETPYTIVIWGYYQDPDVAGHTIYERFVYKINAVTEGLIQRATLEGPLMEGSRHELLRAPEMLSVTVNKYAGHNPTRVLYKHLPGTVKGTFAVEKLKGVREAVSPNKTTNWALSVEPGEILMGEGAAGENTLVIWAVYAIGNVEVYRVDSIRYYCKSKK